MSEEGDKPQFSFDESSPSSDTDSSPGENGLFTHTQLLVLGIVVVVVWVGAGGLFALGYFDEPPPAQHSAEVRFQVANSPGYVYDGISIGAVPTNDNIINVTNKSVITTRSTNSTSKRVMIDTYLYVRNRERGTFFNGKRIYIGKSITVDLGNVVVDSTVTEMNVSHETVTG